MALGADSQQARTRFFFGGGGVLVLKLIFVRLAAFGASLIGALEVDIKTQDLGL